MAVSLESSSPSSLPKDSLSAFSPSSEKNYWSSLRNRVDTLLENRKLDGGHELPLQAPAGIEELEKRKRLRKEDCLLLLRGFDSVSASLSQLTSNLHTAVNGARELAKPSFFEAFPSELEKSAKGERGIKRKIVSVSHESYDDQDDDHEQSVKTGKLTKAKNLAVSMAAKAATLARELKSIKAGLSFMQDRCSVLEEENRMLREGDGKQMRPEEDDLVRLQLEALLAEKSRLANENANLTRENQCLHQLVEYHHLTSQDLSTSYEQVINGTCLDFSSPSPSPPISNFSSPSPSPPIAIFSSPSPSPPVAKDANSEADFVGGNETRRTDKYGLSTSLDGWLCEEQHS